MKYRLNMETARIEDAAALMSLADERGVKFVLLTNQEEGKKRTKITKDGLLKREGTKFIMSEMRRNPSKEFLIEDFEDGFKKLGLSPTSVSPVFSQLKSFDLVRKVGKGKYKLG